jgi:hypothetical protein
MAAIVESADGRLMNLSILRLPVRDSSFIRDHGMDTQGKPSAIMVVHLSYVSRAVT